MDAPSHIGLFKFVVRYVFSFVTHEKAASVPNSLKLFIFVSPSKQTDRVRAITVPLLHMHTQGKYTVNWTGY